jgi:glycogen debranching enzyme
MAINVRTEHRTAEDRPSSEEQDDHRQRVLREGTSAIVKDIATAVVIKDQDLFFLTDADGSVPLKGPHGFGLYYHDCRYVSGYELDLAGHKPTRLVGSGERGYIAMFQFTNLELELGSGCIQRERIGIKWERLLDGKSLALYDRLLFQNFGLESVEFPVSIRFHAAFEDIFSVREQRLEESGRIHAPSWEESRLCFRYEGKDKVHRSLSIYFDPGPDACDRAGATFRIALGPRDSRAILMTLVVSESETHDVNHSSNRQTPDYQAMQARLQEASDAWLARETRLTSDSLLLNRIMEQSRRALGVLQSQVDGHTYFAAGVPWFVALFGRDSLITAMQTLAYDPTIAEQTLRLLAQYQGQRDDEWREEQPGKILHELRVGEKARLGEIPPTPYYGTIDATLLFLSLLGRHAAWTGDLSLFTDLQPCVESALAWMSRDADFNGDGYVDYRRISEGGLANQGWKDSGDAIVNADGALAIPPIALVEVQAYAYEALTLMSDLYQRTGDVTRAHRLRDDANDLRRRFNRDYWVEEKACYALALQDGGQPAAVVSSNAGHALWAGIADADKARRVVERLMSDTMFSGWGVRTLAEDERRYNPMGYHLGTIWPHDNSLIAAGFRRYGYEEAAMQIFRGLLEAAMHFEGYQLPELFCGFPRREYPVPVRYPIACHPQAWASASIPYLLQTILGLEPDAFAGRLHIVRPVLPDFLTYIELHGLQVGRARIDLRFEHHEGKVTVDVMKLDGALDVLVESSSERSRDEER